MEWKEKERPDLTVCGGKLILKLRCPQGSDTLSSLQGHELTINTEGDRKMKTYKRKVTLVEMAAITLMSFAAGYLAAAVLAARWWLP